MQQTEIFNSGPQQGSPTVQGGWSHSCLDLCEIVNLSHPYQITSTVHATITLEQRGVSVVSLLASSTPYLTETNAVSLPD